MLLHGSASILRDCTFECVDLRQLNAGHDRGRPSHPIYPDITPKWGYVRVNRSRSQFIFEITRK